MRFRAFFLSFVAVLFGCVNAAIAADLPIAEPSDQYVRICNAFGAMFFYIPGTNTCLKLSGYVRAESHWVDGDTEILLGGGKNEFNNWTSRARANVMFDAQTSTDLGLIRTFIEIQATRGPGDFDLAYPDVLELPAAFIEVTTDRGVFTAGHTGSFFDFYGSDDYGTRIDVDDSTTEQNLFAYSVIGPSGFRGTLSIEDPDSSGRRRKGVTDDYEGLELPDLVGRLRVDQSWGAAQLSGVLRHINDDNGDGLGWAASGGLSVNLPVDKIVFSTQVGYADGAIAYLTNDPGALGDFAGPDGDNTNQAWMARGGFLVPLTPTVTSWFDGSFTHVEDDTNNNEYDFWAVVAGAAWAPNDRIAVGPEFGYNRIDGDDAGEDGDIWGVMWRLQAGF